MFKKAIIYIFDKKLDPQYFDAEAWAVKLAQFQFIPIANKLGKDEENSISSSCGFGVAHKQINAESLIHATADYMLVNYVEEKKSIPGAIKKLKIEEREELMKVTLKVEKLTREQKDQVKHEIISQLLRKQPEVRKSYPVLINTKERWIAIDGTIKQAETVLAYLRKALGTMPVRPIQVISPENIYTSWVKDPSTLPPQIKLGLGCKLQEGKLAAVSYSKKQELDSDEIISNIEHGKLVVSMGLNFVPGDGVGSIPFNIDSNMLLSSIVWAFSTSDYDSEDSAGIADATLAMTNSTLSALVKVMEANLVHSDEHNQAA